MGEVRGVLLVPEEGDPLGLLAFGVGGYRPPIAVAWNGAWEPLDDLTPEEPPHSALILAWDGEVVDAGCRQAWRCHVQGGRHYLQSHFEGLAFDALSEWERCLGYRESSEREGLRIVLVDAEGREVTP